MALTTSLLKGGGAHVGAEAAAAAVRIERGAAGRVAESATDSIMGTVPRAADTALPSVTAPARSLSPAAARPPQANIGQDAVVHAERTRSESRALMTRALEAAESNPTPKARDTARNATAYYARDTLAHANALAALRVSPSAREAVDQEARKLFSEAGAMFAQAARLDRNAVSPLTNDAIAAFVRGGDSNAVVGLVQHDYARGVGAVFDIVRAAPFAESRTALRVARDVADAGRRAHGEAPLTDTQFNALFEAHQVGRWR